MCPTLIGFVPYTGKYLVHGQASVHSLITNRSKRVRNRPRVHISPKCTLLTTRTDSVKNTYAPVVLFPGLGNSAGDYTELVEKLTLRGHEQVSVVPVRRWQWGMMANSIFLLDYWRGNVKPAPILNWYFKLVDDTLSQLSEHSRSNAINFVGHSAGGWLAQAYIAERAPPDIEVSTLLTLGTPARSPPKGSLDQTRGLLRYIEDNCDVEDKVSRYICVAGRGTVGKGLGKGTFAEYMAYLSYAAVCGRGDTDGDGVTPVDAACAINGELVYCDDCNHSMWTKERWYGSENALSTWTRYLT